MTFIGLIDTGVEPLDSLKFTFPIFAVGFKY